MGMGHVEAVRLLSLLIIVYRLLYVNFTTHYVYYPCSSIHIYPDRSEDCVDDPPKFP